MLENEIMEQWLANNQERPQVLTVEMLTDIILYKSKNIKAHIPAWVFEETFNVLRKNCLNERKVDFKIYTKEDL